jgi:branched-chain amino acid aminotransferase
VAAASHKIASLPTLLEGTTFLSERSTVHKYLFHNDRLLPLDQVRLSPGQAGLFNGWGVFTTLRIDGGQPFAFERHWARLERDARRIDLPLPLSREAALQSVLRMIEANRVESGCARVYFIYNKIGFWKSTEPLPVVDFLAYTTDLPDRGAAVRLAIAEHGRHAAHPLSGTKVTSWLQNVWSVHRAAQRGFDEVILLNERGEVAECTAANLVVCRNGEARTPPLSSGCLAGVTREILLEQAPAWGVTLLEAPLTRADLEAADEIFLTSTTRQVQPVQAIESHKVPSAPGPITYRLRESFDAYVRSRRAP